MADNVTANAGAGGPVFKTDEIDGVHTPISKMAFGADGAVVTVDADHPLPVSIGPVAVTGEVSLDSATLESLGSVEVTNFPATQAVSGTVTANTGLSQPVTDAQLRAADVKVSLDGEQVAISNFPATQPVSGTVAVSNLPASYAVTGTFWQAVQPISASALPLPTGAATQTTLASLDTKTPSLGQAAMASSRPVVIASNQSAIPVTGTFWQATQPISGTVTANTGLAQPVTDAQLRATPVPVSGTITANTGLTQPLTDAQLRASAVPVTTGGLTDTQLRAADIKVSLDGEQVAISNLPATQAVSAVALPLPTGAATDATLLAIQTLSNDMKALTDTLLMYMAAVLEKMPRVTGNDQCAVVAEGGTISTVTTVTTCGTVNTISQIGTRAAMTAGDAMIMQGTSHIYNNILVS